MQTFIPSQQAFQLCGSAINLLQTLAGHVHSLRSVPLSTPSATVPKKSFPKDPAAQLFADRATIEQLRVLPATHNCHPLYPTTARSTLLAPYLNSFVSTRSFHRTHSQLPKISRRWQSQHALPHISPISHQRSFSFFGQQPVPSPQVLAHIHLLETTANASPTSVSAQLAYMKSLVDSGLPRALERVTSRWERMIEFDQANPVLRSTEGFQLYLTALVRSDSHASVDHAVKRRDQILAMPTTAASAPEAVASYTQAPSPTPQDQSGDSAPIPPIDNALPQPPLTASQPSSSQQVAQSVLATHAATPSTSFASSLFGTKSKWFGLGGANLPPTNPLAGISGVAGGGRENPIYVTVAEPKGSMVYRLIRFLIFTAVGAFFTLVIFAVLLENSGLLKAGPKSTAEFEPVEGKVVKFSDVHGVDEAKDELQEIVAFLRDPTSFSTLGGKLPKGVLLTGPPGTGKTLLARAVAGEAGVPFLFASGSEFDEMFVGVGAKRIRDLFAAARKKQPAIIFIDELDAIGSKRSPRDQHYVKQTLNQLLVEMDGFQQSEGVIVIGATNFPQSLDQALVRPGRFDRKITVPLPDIKGRVQILKHHMRNVITSDDVDAAVLARGTPGFSGADLENMVNQAAVKASRDGCDSILLRHFEWAKDRIIMGAERRSTYIAPKVKRLTAYHEGGHALVALYTDGAMPLHKVTCMPRGDSLGHTSQLPEDDRYSVSFKEYIAEMDVSMGGRIAEELIYGAENTTSGCYSDLAYATDVASRLVQFYGFSNKLGPVFLSDNNPISTHKRQEIEAEVRSLLEASQERARRILGEREEELHRLADALVEYESLDLDEVKKVVKGEPIREYERLEEIA